MARAFRRKGTGFVAKLDDVERTILTGMMEQTRVLLSPEVETTGDAFGDLVASLGTSLADDTDGVDTPSDTEDVHRDPALDRLLPTAHRGDEQVAAEFRRLTEEGLRQRKSANLDVAVAALGASERGRVRLDEKQAHAFLIALTDVRLLLGERLGMRTEEDAEALHAALETADDDDPLGYAMAWYEFLTWLQETLAHALMGEGLEEVGESFDPDEDLADDEHADADDAAADDASDGDAGPARM